MRICIAICIVFNVEKRIKVFDQAIETHASVIKENRNPYKVDSVDIL